MRSKTFFFFHFFSLFLFIIVERWGKGGDFWRIWNIFGDMLKFHVCFGMPDVPCIFLCMCGQKREKGTSDIPNKYLKIKILAYY